VCVCVYRTIHSVIILDSFDSFSNLRTISANLDYNRAGHIIRQATHVSSGVSQDPEEAMEVKTVVRIRTNPDITVSLMRYTMLLMIVAIESIQVRKWQTSKKTQLLLENQKRNPRLEAAKKICTKF